MHEYYTIRKAAQLIGHPVRTVRYWVVTGKIKAIKDPFLNKRRWLIPKAEVERLIQKEEGADYANEDGEFAE